MSRPVVLLSALLPPLRGGLADHTRRLAAELAARGPVTVLTSPGADPIPSVDVRPVVGDWRDTDSLRRAIDACPRDAVLLWQYVPHMYGRGGVNRRLMGLMERLHDDGRRQIVLAHEIWAGWTWRPHWLWYSLNHLWQWRRILRVADFVPTSTERWIQEWSRRRPSAAPKFLLAPSPSNIPVVPVPADHRERWRAAHGWAPDTRVLAFFGTLNVFKQFGWVLDAWKSAHARGERPVLCLAGDAPPSGIPASCGLGSSRWDSCRPTRLRGCCRRWICCCCRSRTVPPSVAGA
ncbi:MAG: glycosyltransferase family 4 protein [Verrucomicrobia bacterium]|nr:MAG: glycosyltransferase family 4 protein [Verrucomicrobiota bacterium]